MNIGFLNIELLSFLEICLCDEISVRCELNSGMTEHQVVELDERYFHVSCLGF